MHTRQDFKKNDYCYLHVFKYSLQNLILQSVKIIEWNYCIREEAKLYIKKLYNSYKYKKVI